MGRRTKLTQEVQEIIIQAIRQGCFDWVAAQAGGITPQTFGNWMRWGEKGNPRYLAFFSEVQSAKAETRRKAEAKVFAEDAFKWLRYGPGRERPGEPGWTESAQLEHSGPAGGPVEIRIIPAIPRPEEHDGSDD